MMETAERTAFVYEQTTDKPFDEVVASIEKQTAEHKFRVLHVHDVQATLAEKGIDRDPVKIIEVCNAQFANEALNKSADVALFMPCRFSVHTLDDRTVVKLGRPTMIAQMMPGIGLDELAESVETTLKEILHASV
jgi:uncharacterized protein (DUF302 family)